MPESKRRKKPQQARPSTAAAKSPAPTPTWWVPTAVTLLVVGLLWVVTTYILEGRYPVPNIGNWNLAIGFTVLMSGFLMTLRWR